MNNPIQFDAERLLTYIDENAIVPTPAPRGWDHLGAIVVDSALQRRQKYDATVLPRVQRVAAEWPDASTARGFLNHVAAGDLAEMADWNGEDRLTQMRATAEALLSLQINTVEDLRGALSVEPRRTEVRNALRTIHNVGPKTMDYFDILAGLSNTAVDSRIEAVTAAAGIANTHYEYLHDVVVTAAQQRGWDLRDLDHALWSFRGFDDVDLAGVQPGGACPSPAAPSTTINAVPMDPAVMTSPSQVLGKAKEVASRVRRFFAAKRLRVVVAGAVALAVAGVTVGFAVQDNSSDVEGFWMNADGEVRYFSSWGWISDVSHNTGQTTDLFCWDAGSMTMWNCAQPDLTRQYLDLNADGLYIRPHNDPHDFHIGFLWKPITEDRFVDVSMQIGEDERQRANDRVQRADIARCVTELFDTVDDMSKGNDVAFFRWGQSDPRQRAALTLHSEFWGNIGRLGGEGAARKTLEQIRLWCQDGGYRHW
ncbi:MAG: hypothetical protein LBH13_09465 [Cellulomonadaceae bacterium]|jgi:hypothetical protein|nr:hypothetical protein [Cellulomonadaceae bacterium]